MQLGNTDAVKEEDSVDYSEDSSNDEWRNWESLKEFYQDESKMEKQGTQVCESIFHEDEGDTGNMHDDREVQTSAKGKAGDAKENEETQTLGDTVLKIGKVINDDPSVENNSHAHVTRADDQHTEPYEEEGHNLLEEEIRIWKDLDQRKDKRKRILKEKKLMSPYKCSQGKNIYRKCKHLSKSGDIVGSAYVVTRDKEGSDSEEYIGRRNLILSKSIPALSTILSTSNGKTYSYEVARTIEVGTIVGFKLDGKQELVKQLLVENGVQTSND
ncbi:hypothetical protein L6452_35691 [Arctium lappa]|uniref:Uncharacterized protein n=1 Tax=Arctium lappa TaxID=4217 RepID=A0ACB8Y7N7_ARCLA|nr:hypothetical protein L6452_35691 [Arctium lappa]